MAAKETYRLQALLGMRERKKEEAERYLGDCIKALKEEQDRLAAMEKELERMVAHREAKRREYSEQVMRGEMSAQSAISAEQFIKRLKELEEAHKEAIEGQKEVIKQREEDVSDARKELAARTQELKALEKHKEKWKKQLQKEREAKAEAAMDEVAQTIFLSKDK